MRIAVVTGAAGGIGAALARRLADTGHQVHLADLADTADLATEVGGVAHAVDVTHPADLDRLAAAAGDAEVVCLNAGVVGTSTGAPWETPPEEWQRLLDVNLLGVVNGLRAFVPAMLTRERPGRLIITASLAGLVTFPGGGAYAATKHALVAVSEQAALALRDTRVSVTLLCPALVRSGMSETGEDPNEVARQVLAAAEEGRFLVVPPEWEPAVVTRAERLVTGAAPDLPAPAHGTRSTHVSRARPGGS
jgi:NAD(P)-dependent dehydrogenase (short-subunit alcohol dehydrogenase family)